MDSTVPMASTARANSVAQREQTRPPRRVERAPCILHPASVRRAPGQSLVEFGLVAMLLLFIIFGAFDYFQILMAHHAVAQATAAAAHQAALIGGDDGPNGSVVQTARSLLDAGVVTRAAYATITVTCQAPCQRYQPITVRIVYDDAVWVPLPGVPARVHVDHQTVRAAEKDQEALYAFP